MDELPFFGNGFQSHQVMHSNVGSTEMLIIGIKGNI